MQRLSKAKGLFGTEKGDTGGITMGGGRNMQDVVERSIYEAAVSRQLFTEK